MDVSGLSLQDLRNLQAQLKKEIKKREHEDIRKAREQIMAIAQSVGMPLKDLLAGHTRIKTSAVEVRYRHPSDATLEWTGRGRQPKWVKDSLALGLTLDALSVK